MKTIIKKLVLTFVIAVFFISFSGQQASAQLFTGGDVNFSLLDGVTIDLAPTIGYKYRNFRAGLSPIVAYTATGAAVFKGDVSLGAKIYAEYDIWKGILAHVEFKAMYTGYTSLNENGFKVHKVGWVIGSPIGVGYQRDLGNGLWIKALVLYDPFIDININTQNSALGNPSISGGVTYLFHK